MTIFDFVLVIAGTLLILLGMASGLAIFFQAAKASKQKESMDRASSLWGLFVFGVAVGLILLALGLPSMRMAG